MGAILSVLGSMILTLAGYAVQEAVTAYGARTKDKLTSIARAIYSKMSSNQKYLDQLYDAYINKRSSLQSLLMTGSGFGPRINAIYKALQKEENDYKSEKAAKTDEQSKLTNDYNETNNALMQAGTGLVATNAADKVAKQMDQYVTGGLTNE